MANSRTKNSALNIATSLLEYFIKMLLVFVSRTIFIRVLGAEFLGLDGLFTNILSLLSISELGFSAAITFSMYKPIAEKNKEKLNILMFVYKKFYQVIGCVIFVLGIVIMFFLPDIVGHEYNFGNIYLLFSLYLIQTLATYWFFSYKEAIIIAHQKKYRLTFVVNLMAGLKFVFQVISLLLFKSFEGYIISGIITTLIKNIAVKRIADKEYPFAKTYNGMKLAKKEKTELTKNIFGMSLYKISSAVMNSTDNIVISTFIDLTTTGLYSNYLLIVTNIKNILSTFFYAFAASVGNLYAEGNREKSEFIFRCINFLNFWLYGFAAICLWELLNPFIALWLGDEFIFAGPVVFVIVLNFITDGLQQAVILYKDACGLFWKGKLRPIFSAIFNVIFSVILVHPLGIAGVLLGSIISRMITTWWFDPYLVYRNAFKMSPRGYYYRYARSLLLIIAMIAVIDLVMHFVNVDLVGQLILRSTLCLVVPNVFFWVLFRRSKEFRHLRSIVIRKLKRK